MAEDSDEVSEIMWTRLPVTSKDDYKHFLFFLFFHGRWIAHVRAWTSGTNSNWCDRKCIERQKLSRPHGSGVDRWDML